MPKSDLRSVQVNLTNRALQDLHVVAQVTHRPVGELIREAVDAHIAKFSSTDEFRIQARAFEEQHSATLARLLNR